MSERDRIEVLERQIADLTKRIAQLEQDKDARLHNWSSVPHKGSIR